MFFLKIFIFAVFFAVFAAGCASSSGSGNGIVHAPPLSDPATMARRADELAVAMESRCYHGGEGRTRMKQLRLVRRDYLALLAGAALLAAVITLNVFGL